LAAAKHLASFSNLSEHRSRYLPVASAEAERVFSVAGLVSSDRKNRRKGSGLEQKVLIKKNAAYIE